MNNNDPAANQSDPSDEIDWSEILGAMESVDGYPVNYTPDSLVAAATQDHDNVNPPNDPTPSDAAMQEATQEWNTIEVSEYGVGSGSEFSNYHNPNVLDPNLVEPGIAVSLGGHGVQLAHFNNIGFQSDAAIPEAAHEWSPIDVSEYGVASQSAFSGYHNPLDVMDTSLAESGIPIPSENGLQVSHFNHTTFQSPVPRETVTTLPCFSDPATTSQSSEPVAAQGPLQIDHEYFSDSDEEIPQHSGVPGTSSYNKTEKHVPFLPEQDGTVPAIQGNESYAPANPFDHRLASRDASSKTITLGLDHTVSRGADQAGEVSTADRRIDVWDEVQKAIQYVQPGPDKMDPDQYVAKKDVNLIEFSAPIWEQCVVGCYYDGCRKFGTPFRKSAGSTWHSINSTYLRSKSIESLVNHVVRRHRAFFICERKLSNGDQCGVVVRGSATGVTSRNERLYAFVKHLEECEGEPQV